MSDMSLIRCLVLHLQHRWAVLRGDHFRALKILEQITMADLSALSAAIDRVTAKAAADAAALQTALDANAGLQPEIDALTAKLDAIAPAPVEPVAQAADEAQAAQE